MTGGEGEARVRLGAGRLVRALRERAVVSCGVISAILRLKGVCVSRGML